MHICDYIMDGKLLILCDEDPRSEDKFTIPEDRTFIEECKLYAFKRIDI